MNTGLENLAWGLAKLGCDVHVLSGGDEPAAHDYKLPRRVRYHFTGRTGTPRSFVKPFRDLSRQFSFNVVVGWIRNISLLAYATDRLSTEGGPVFIANQGAIIAQPERWSRRPSVQAPHGMSLSTLAIRGTLRFLAKIWRALPDSQFVYGQIHRVVSISDSVSSNVKHVYGVPDEKCLVIHRGVDTSLFCASKRTEPNTPPKMIRILYTGNVIPAKGVANLVGALEQIATPTQLVLCGNGSKAYFEEMKAQLAVSSNGQVHRLDWRGPLGQKELVLEYQNADFFVFPSYSEGLGKSLLEAMACELPVISSDLPAVREIIDHRVNGLLVPVGSSKGIALAIQEYLENPELQQRCGENARQTVLEHFSFSNELESWMGVISESTFCHQ